MASTMIFCTGYLSDETSWEQRYERWLAHHKKVFPEASFFIIDDGSPFLPTNPRVSIKSDLSDLTAADYANFFYFPNRLGRRTVTDFPGWFRSFTFSVSIARKLGYSKIVHIESDAFALTRRAAQYVETREDGWVAFYCPRYKVPETAFQIICSDAFEALETVRDTPYEANYSQKFLELSLPFTHVETNIHGDRYGEFRSRIPRSADFGAQIDKNVSFRSEFELS